MCKKKSIFKIFSKMIFQATIFKNWAFYELSGKLNLHYPLHPMLKKSFDFLKPHFENIVIKEQNLLSS